MFRHRAGIPHPLSFTAFNLQGLLEMGTVVINPILSPSRQTRKTGRPYSSVLGSCASPPQLRPADSYPLHRTSSCFSWILRQCSSQSLSPAKHKIPAHLMSPVPCVFGSTHGWWDWHLIYFRSCFGKNCGRHILHRFKQTGFCMDCVEKGRRPEEATAFLSSLVQVNCVLPERPQLWCGNHFGSH